MRNIYTDLNVNVNLMMSMTKFIDCSEKWLQGNCSYVMFLKKEKYNCTIGI